MLFFLIQKLGNAAISPFDFCPQFSDTDCMNCWQKGQDSNISCGWCSSSNKCMPGDIFGPVIGTCESGWEGNNTETCQKESSSEFSTGAKVGIGLFAGIVAIVTAVFWIFIFPKIFN